MDKVLKLSRPALIFTFVILACAVVPGILVLNNFLPELIMEGKDGILLSGLLASSLPVMASFATLSISGTAKGEAADNQRFMSEFTFACFTCALSYYISLAICYFNSLEFGWFFVMALPIWGLSLWFFKAAR